MTLIGWRRATIAECLSPLKSSNNIRLQTKDYRPSGLFPIIDQGQEFIAGWTDNEYAVISEDLPLIVFGDHTRALKFIDQPFVRGADGTQLLKPKPEFDTLFFYYACKWVDVSGRGYNRHFSVLKESEINIPESKQEQESIGLTLRLVDQNSAQQGILIEQFQQLKSTTMQSLFSRGLRGEPQRDTEIGSVPESWRIDRLDAIAQVISTRMSYEELKEVDNISEGINVQGVKVSDMNSTGNELEIYTTSLEKIIPLDMAQKKCAPPFTIIFPKRGAAIATNKKRLSREWTVFDPNVIGVYLEDRLATKYVFQWFQNFDLRNITEPGPTPQLNKKHVEPILIPFPSTQDELVEIVAILDAIDRKIDLHRRKRAVLEELFKSLLHKLMTGELRVGDLNLAALGLEPQEVAQ